VRTDSIVICGQTYPVKGLSVSQSLTEDILAAEANSGSDVSAKVNVRLRRMALSLKNSEAFLPDPASPIDEATGQHKGQLGTKDMPVDKITKLLDADLFSDAAEFYEAEAVVMKLTGFLKSEASQSKDGPKGAGESVAAE
jgi:hypothetical protein